MDDYVSLQSFLAVIKGGADDVYMLCTPTGLSSWAEDCSLSLSPRNRPAKQVYLFTTSTSHPRPAFAHSAVGAPRAARLAWLEGGGRMPEPAHMKKVPLFSLEKRWRHNKHLVPKLRLLLLLLPLFSVPLLLLLANKFLSPSSRDMLSSLCAFSPSAGGKRERRKKNGV